MTSKPGAFLVASSLAVAMSTAAAAQPSDLQAAAIARGQALAEARCSVCHATGREGESPNRRAPLFRALSGRFVSLSLQRTLTEIAETGHFDMPPQPVHTDEIEALAAYINSLDAPPVTPGRSPPPRPR